MATTTMRYAAPASRVGRTRALSVAGASLAAVVVWAVAVPPSGTHLLIRFGSAAAQSVGFEYVVGASLTDQDITDTLRSLPGSDRQPDGILVRIVGASDKGTYVIEVWNSDEDARRVAEQSASTLGAVSLPPPTRVDGFEAPVAFIRAAQSG